MAKNITILKFERDILFEELCSYNNFDLIVA